MLAFCASGNFETLIKTMQIELTEFARERADPRMTLKFGISGDRGNTQTSRKNGVS